MTPLDDELHDALHQRAATIDPPTDPMAGIELRARGLRRRRLAATVAGGALVIVAVAVAVPALLPGRLDGSAPPVTSQPTLSSSSYELDPSAPWAPRGNELPAQTHQAFQQAWTAKHPGSTFSPLFSQVYESSQQQEAVFVSNGPGGARYGFVTGTPSAPSFLYDEQLPPHAKVLAFTVFGDETNRLLAVAAPEVRTFELSTGHGPLSAMTALADGVAGSPAQGSLDLQVTAPDGSVLYSGPVWAAEAPAGDPSNVLSWPQRGTAALSPSTDELKTAFATSLGRSAEAAKVHYRALFVSNTGRGEAFTVGQAWFAGDRQAYSVSYAAGGTTQPTFFIGKPTPANPVVLAFVVPNLQGMSDLLVVVPQPNTGQVLYDDNGAGAFRPITGQDQRDGVVLIDRSTRATNDRLQLLDGNGNLNQPTFEGPVAPLLCGLKGCG